MFVLLYAAVGLLAVYIFLRNKQGKENPVPGPAGLPIVGFAFKFNIRTVDDTLAKFAEIYGDIFKIKTFGQNMIFVNSAEMVRSIFCTDPCKRYTNDRPVTFTRKYVPCGSKSVGIVDAYNSPHGDLRKAFTRGMHVYGVGMTSFETKVQMQLTKLNEDIERIGGKEFDMHDILLKSLSNIMSTFLIGEDLGDDEKDANIYWELIQSFNYIARPDVNLILMTFPFLRFVPGFYKKPFDTFLQAQEKVLKLYYYDAKKTYQPGVVRGLVDFYLAEQRQAETEGRSVLFNDEQICALVLDAIIAGILTSFSTLYSVFFCLINHPEYQTRIQEEIDRVVDKQELPSLSNREDCVFIEAVFLEASRLITPAPLLIPHYCRPQVEFEGYTIPTESMIFANAWYIHHDKKIWGDPYTFRPERWIDHDGHLLQHDHVLRKNWLVFGTGRRQCIGESLARSRIFLYISTLLQRWNFEMTPEHSVPCDPRAGHMDVEFLCRPKPYLCRVVPRKYDKRLQT